MLVDAYMKCYATYRDEFMVIPKHCPLNKEFCYGGTQCVGDEKVEFNIMSECEYYDNDSYNRCNDGCIECNFNETGGYE